MTVPNTRRGNKRPRDPPASEKVLGSSIENFVRCAIFATFCNPHENTLDTLNRNIYKKYSILINLEDNIESVKKTAIELYQKLYGSKPDSKEVCFSSLFASDGSELADDMIFGSLFKEGVQLFFLLTSTSDISGSLGIKESTPKNSHVNHTVCGASCGGYIKTLLKTLDDILEHHSQSDIPVFKRRKHEITETEKITIPEACIVSSKPQEIKNTTNDEEPKTVSQHLLLQTSRVSSPTLINEQTKKFPTPLSINNSIESCGFENSNKALDLPPPSSNEVLDIPHDNRTDTAHIEQKSPHSPNLSLDLNKSEAIDQNHYNEPISLTDSNHDSEYILAENTPLNSSPSKSRNVKSFNHHVSPKITSEVYKSLILQKDSQDLKYVENDQSSATESLFSDIDTDDESHLIPRTRPVVLDISPRQRIPGKQKSYVNIPKYCIFSEDDSLIIKSETGSISTPMLNGNSSFTSKAKLASKEEYNSDDSMDFLVSNLSEIKKENGAVCSQDTPKSNQLIASPSKKETVIRKTRGRPPTVKEAIPKQNPNPINPTSTKVAHDLSSQKNVSSENKPRADAASDIEPEINGNLDFKKEYLSPQDNPQIKSNANKTVNSALSHHINKDKPSTSNLNPKHDTSINNQVSSQLSVSNDKEKSSDESSEDDSASEVEEVSNSNFLKSKDNQFNAGGVSTIRSESTQKNLNPSRTAHTTQANSTVNNKSVAININSKAESTTDNHASSQGVISNEEENSSGESSEGESESDSEADSVADSENDSLESEDRQVKTINTSTLKQGVVQSTPNISDHVQKNQATSVLADAENKEDSSKKGSEEESESDAESGSENDSESDAESGSENDSDSDAESGSENDSDSDAESSQNTNEQEKGSIHKAAQGSSNPTGLLPKDQTTPLDSKSDEENSSEESSEEESELESDSESVSASPKITNEQVSSLADKTTSNSAFLNGVTIKGKNSDFIESKSKSKLPQLIQKKPQSVVTHPSELQNSSEDEDTSEGSSEDDSDASSDEAEIEKDTATAHKNSLNNSNEKCLSIPHFSTNDKQSEQKPTELESEGSSGSDSSGSSEESEGSSSEDTDTPVKNNKVSSNITEIKPSKSTSNAKHASLSQLDVPLEQPVSTGVMSPGYFKSLKRLPSLEGRYAATQNKRQRTASLASLSLSQSAVASPNLLDMNPPSESSGSEEDSDTSSEDENVTIKPSTQPSLISNNAKSYKPKPSPVSKPNNNVVNRNTKNLKAKAKKSSLLDLLHE